MNTPASGHPNGHQNSGQNGAHPVSDRVTLVSVGDPVHRDDGSIYVVCRFKRGPLGKPTSRTFWGRTQPDGSFEWDRASPDELRALLGTDLTGIVSVEAVDHAPYEFVSKATGEVITVSSSVVVRFADETLQQAMRRYNLEEAVASPALPAGFVALPTNGHAVPDAYL